MGAAAAAPVRRVPKLAWIPWLVFALLELAGGQWLAAVLFATAGLVVSVGFWMRLNRSQLRETDGVVEWRNWPGGWRNCPVTQIAGVRSAKGVNRVHCELIVALPSGRITKRAVWARHGDEAAALAREIGAPCVNRA